MGLFCVIENFQSWTSLVAVLLYIKSNVLVITKDNKAIGVILWKPEKRSWLIEQKIIFQEPLGFVSEPPAFSNPDFFFIFIHNI